MAVTTTVFYGRLKNAAKDVLSKDNVVPLDSYCWNVIPSLPEFAARGRYFTCLSKNARDARNKGVSL